MIHKIIIFIILIIGYALLGIAEYRFRKLEKEHLQKSDSEFLLEDEKAVQNKSIKIYIAGVILTLTTNIIIGLFWLFS